MGGASRLLAELQRYVDQTGRRGVFLIGDGRPLTPRWLMARERAASGATRRVALNNVSFQSGLSRTVLLRNALHFPLPGERVDVGSRRRFALESAVVRVGARRADRVVVPSSSMAERVARWLPRISGRMVVWPHPVTPVELLPREPGLIVCPVLFAPYKGMGVWLRALAHSAGVLRESGTHVTVQVTATAAELSAEDVPMDDVTPVGRLTVQGVQDRVARATAVFYPTTLESFGYPLAEARANGQPVLAVDCAHNREVAGPALVPFAADGTDLTEALRTALDRVVEPDVVEPASKYFDRLLGAV